MWKCGGIGGHALGKRQRACGKGYRCFLQCACMHMAQGTCDGKGWMVCFLQSSAHATGVVFCKHATTHTLRLVLVHGLDEQGAGQAEEARVEGGLGRMEHEGLRSPPPGHA